MKNSATPHSSPRTLTGKANPPRNPALAASAPSFIAVGTSGTPNLTMTESVSPYTTIAFAGYPFATLVAPRTHVEDLPGLDGPATTERIRASRNTVKKSKRLADEAAAAAALAAGKPLPDPGKAAVKPVKKQGPTVMPAVGAAAAPAPAAEPGKAAVKSVKKQGPRAQKKVSTTPSYKVGAKAAGGKAASGPRRPVAGSGIVRGNKFNEVQKYMSMTRHAYTAMPVVMNKAKFASFTPAQQQVLIDAALAAGSFQRELIRKNEAGDIAYLRSQGMVIEENINAEPFRKLVAEPIKQLFAEKHGTQLIDAIVSTR